MPHQPPHNIARIHDAKYLNDYLTELDAAIEYQRFQFNFHTKLAAESEHELGRLNGYKRETQQRLKQLEAETK